MDEEARTVGLGVGNFPGSCFRGTQGGDSTRGAKECLVLFTPIRPCGTKHSGLIRIPWTDTSWCARTNLLVQTPLSPPQPRGGREVHCSTTATTGTKMLLPSSIAAGVHSEIGSWRAQPGGRDGWRAPVQRHLEARWRRGRLEVRVSWKKEKSWCCRRATHITLDTPVILPCLFRDRRSISWVKNGVSPSCLHC